MLVIICFSCASKGDTVQKTVNLEVNGYFHKFNNEARICLDSIFNDSRCPTGIECVWEGDALAAFTLTKDDTDRSFTLHANNKFQNDTIIDGIKITLLNITPYPIANQKIDPTNYNAEIRVEEN